MLEWEKHCDEDCTIKVVLSILAVAIPVVGVLLTVIF